MKYAAPRSETYPFAISKSEKYFPEFIDGKRRVVLRTTHSAMELLKPDPPIQYQPHVEPRLSSANLLTLRFHDIDNLNDGCIISQTAANRLEAYRNLIQKFEVPAGAELTWSIEPSADVDGDLRRLYFGKILAPPEEGKYYLFDSIARKANLSEKFPEILACAARMEQSTKQIVRPQQIICKIRYSLGSNDEGIENTHTVIVRSKM